MDGEEGLKRRHILVLALVLLGIALASGIDLVLDSPRRWLSFHAIYELAVLAGGLITATALWMAWARAERSIVAMRRSLEERSAERDEWQSRARQALDGLSRAIDEQLRAWKLTPAEREIAIQLLKGRSHKEIAADTGRSERTVRQHAVVIYQKAGLGGRAELGAFFLEGLMVPPQEGPHGAQAASEVRSGE
jgi:DNA-binding CsgD family transcriptional regulator